MRIESVNKRYLAITFKTIAFIVTLLIVGQLVFSVRYAQTEKKRQLKDLNSTILSYQYNISEKLSILTSSNTFLDYLRSGDISRQSNSLDMNVLFAKFKDHTISGISLRTINEKQIFSFGHPSELQLTLKLCYLNDFLDSNLGSCRHVIKIYFLVDELVARLKTMNPNIIECKDCMTSFEVDRGKLGSFDTIYTGEISLPINLASPGDYRNFLYFEILFLIVLLVIFFVVHRSFGRISRDYIYTPIKGIVAALNSGEKVELSKVSIYEIKFLGEAINNFISTSRDQEELRRNASLGQMATQVAHDIRSPLEVLKGFKEDIAPLPEASRRKIQLGINRIEEITHKLLSTYKHAGEAELGSRPEDLLSIVTSVVSEKRIEYRSHPYFEIRDCFDIRSYGLFSNVHRSTIRSIVSNLINNSTEALDGTHGVIDVFLFSEESRNIIQIKDNGHGIPLEVKECLFTKGFTTKDLGNGLGLYNAKQEIEAIGGAIEFDSEVGKGASFKIILPKSEAPKLFIPSIDTYKYDNIIILDDDPSFHEVWDKRFEGLGLNVEHIYSVKEMLFKYKSLDPRMLLLSDFELMDERYDGIGVIAMLNHSEHSVLVTARNEEQEIQDRCLNNGIKLLPKSLVNHIKIVPADPASHRNQGPEVVLIDDDRLVHINWSLHCKKHGFSFQGFKSIEEFVAAASGLDKSSKIFIDSSLADGVKGEVESEKIFNLGFLNLYLATGYEKDSITKPHWIKEIYSKSPECI